jgi:hypothetical protein
MNAKAQTLLAVAIVAVVVLVWFGLGKLSQSKANDETAQALVNEWADRLDGQTKDSGSYILYRLASESSITEATDPWERCLVVQYSKGGFSEILKVRSLGPDGKTHTSDDIVAERQSTNLSGIGSGIKNNVEETAERAGRGGASGVVQGLAEGAKKVREKGLDK